MRDTHAAYHDWQIQGSCSMPTYQELRSTYGQLTLAELQDLALRPFELTAQAQTALAEELSSRDVPADDDTPTPQTRTSASAASLYRRWLPVIQAWASSHGGWLTVFQAWVTLQIAAFLTVFALFGPGLGWSLVSTLAAVAVLSVGLVLIATNNPLARRFWPVLLAVWLVASLMGIAALGRFRWHTPLSIAILIAWYLYWLKSKRVAAEFSRASPPASTCEQPER
jgi:hypothetical protein